MKIALLGQLYLGQVTNTMTKKGPLSITTVADKVLASMNLGSSSRKIMGIIPLRLGNRPKSKIVLLIG